MFWQKVIGFILPVLGGYGQYDYTGSSTSNQTLHYRYNSTHGLNNSTIDEVFQLHRALVEIPSVTLYELEVGQVLEAYLTSRGLTVDRQQVSEDRFNLLAYKGAVNETRVLLVSHIDTVPPFFNYSLSEDGYQIYGRGSVDDKASVVAQTFAFLELLDTLAEGGVSILFDVGEEAGGAGINYIEANIDYHWDTVIFGEPTELKLGVGHKGVYGGSLKVNGLAAHSGYPELGIDANGILIDILSNLRGIEWPSDELLGNTTLNIGVIEGGAAANVISANASAQLLFRVTNGIDLIDALVQDAIDRTGHSDRVEFTGTHKLPPVYFDYNVEGFESIVLAYGTDAFGLAKNQIPHKLLYGPGTIHVAHSATEHISTDDLLEAVQGYKSLIKWALEQ